METKKYLLIYDKDSILYCGEKKNMGLLTIGPDVTIESFDELKELSHGKEKVEQRILNNTESPEQYYNQLIAAAEIIKNAANKLYNNLKHQNILLTYNELTIGQFDNKLHEAAYIILEELMENALGGEYTND